VLRCSTSLWSADLANLANEIKRVEPYSTRFHIDVVDGHYYPTLLFFPDLVKALRPHTELPFEVHLMTTDPLIWIEPFIEAGADVILCQFDSMSDPREAIDAVKAAGKGFGIALALEEPVSALQPYWADLDLVTIIGGQIGVKGLDMDARVPDKIREARAEITARGLATVVQADGGIRRHTVPLIHAAGADYIVPGSLMFGEDPAEIQEWLASL
jgi:ribulose-phosphate 3-epimerase